MVNVNVTRKPGERIEFDGFIMRVYETKLRLYLKTPEKIEAMKNGMSRIPSYLSTKDEIEIYKEKRIDSTVLVVVYKLETDTEEKTVSEWFNIPQISGMNRSLLRAVQLYQNLPNETDEWIGKKIKAQLQNNGYIKMIY